MLFGRRNRRGGPSSLPISTATLRISAQKFTNTTKVPRSWLFSHLNFIIGQVSARSALLPLVKANIKKMWNSLPATLLLNKYNSLVFKPRVNRFLLGKLIPLQTSSTLIRRVVVKSKGKRLI